MNFPVFRQDTRLYHYSFTVASYFHLKDFSYHLAVLGRNSHSR
nr:MAG TPA: hypothetical protein [Caudoviricetes sp.]